MKNLTLKLLFIFFIVNFSYSQEWVTSLDNAQRLALVQNKMVLMVWKEAISYPYMVLVENEKGNTVVIENMFADENVSQLIWENFVPVIVNENQYVDLYEKIKGKRNQRYIEKFNDDTIKIMDINGNIINTSSETEVVLNITELIKTYALNTEFLSSELIVYRQDKNFYSAYYLASKYLDYSVFFHEALREKIIDLSNIYLDEALAFLETDVIEDKMLLVQRAELLKMQENLILNKPKKVLRHLIKMDAENINNSNDTLVSFLYYVAYSMLKDENNSEQWKTKVSLLNLRKAQMIININR